jgi:pimeloyl-ACP methyl ester carboxylesterase
MQLVIPDLGWWQTWWRLEPLRQRLEAIALTESQLRPKDPWRIIGHSMGGLLWLELLSRRRDWWPRIHSLVLIASPVGGADLARFLDPLGLGIGIARDLSLNRRLMAEALAASIPTLVIAGNTDGSSDGTIPVQSTLVNGATYRCFEQIGHADLKRDPRVVEAIRQFWQQPHCPPARQGLLQEVIRYLQAVPGMTDGRSQHFSQGQLVLTLPDQTQLYHWRSPWGFDQVFLVTKQGQCCFSGFVGWLHRLDLAKAIASLERRYTMAREVGAGG